ncbi:MAG: MFS transporter [Pseudomonadales bacterium]|nr:MFS transporter [Pseudomonadales bacterium]
MAQSPVSLRLKFFFAIGQAAESIKNFGFGTLLMLYYNQVLGLSGSYAGLAVAIAIAADAISDPAVGSWSDGIRSKLGRRHPFMYAAALPLAVTYYFLFMPPEGLTEFELFLWFTTFAILVRTALTLFHVPYLSLGAEMTQDYHERTKIVVFRTAFGIIASFVVIAIAWNFFFIKTPDNPTPQLTREPYFEYALLSSIIMSSMMFVSTWGTKEVIPHLAGARQAARPFSMSKVYSDLFQALQNPSFRALFVGTLLFFIYAGIQAALSMHLKTFYWELDTKAIEYWQYAAVAGGIFGLPLVPLFNRWFDKKWTVIIGVIGAAIAGTLPVMMKVFGLMPSDPDILVPILVALALLGSVSGVQAGVTVASMMGDIADEHELNHGTRQEGIYFGSYSFSAKCTSALGNLCAGFILDIISFPTNSKPGMVPEDVLTHFGWVYGVVALILIFSTWVFWPYSLDKRRHAEIVEALSKRRMADPDPVPVEEAPRTPLPGNISPLPAGD